MLFIIQLENESFHDRFDTVYNTCFIFLTISNPGPNESFE